MVSPDDIFILGRPLNKLINPASAPVINCHPISSIQNSGYSALITPRPTSPIFAFLSLRSPPPSFCCKIGTITLFKLQGSLSTFPFLPEMIPSDNLVRCSSCLFKASLPLQLLS